MVIKGRVGKIWIAPSALAFVLVGLATVSISRQGIGSVARSHVDAAALLAKRSPGERAPGAVTQTKLALLHNPFAPESDGPFAPAERVLSSVRSRPGGPVGATAVPGVPGAVLPGGDAVPTGAIAEAIPSFPNGVGPVIGGGLVAGIPPGGGGGTGGSGGGGGNNVTPPTTGDVSPPITPPTAAVPEPATWLTMILGLAAVGGLWRRRRGAGSGLAPGLLPTAAA